MNPNWMHGRPAPGWDIPNYGRPGYDPRSYNPGYDLDYGMEYYNPRPDLSDYYDLSYGMGYDDPFTMRDPRDIDLNRRRQEAAMDERTADPERLVAERCCDARPAEGDVWTCSWCRGVGLSWNYGEFMTMHLPSPDLRCIACIMPDMCADLEPSSIGREATPKHSPKKWACHSSETTVPHALVIMSTRAPSHQQA